MSDFQIEFEQLMEEEAALQFRTVSRRRLLKLGLALVDAATAYPESVAVEISLQGLVVFRYFSDGATLDSEAWLERKRRTVELMSMSSLRFMAWLGLRGETLADRKLDANLFAAGGGGFPLAVRRVGQIGSICVSGLSDHRDDHRLITEVLAKHLHSVDALVTS